MTDKRPRAWRRAQDLRCDMREGRTTSHPIPDPIKRRKDLWRRRDRMYHDTRKGVFGHRQMCADQRAWQDEREADT